MLKLKNLERWLEAEKRRFLELSSIADLEAARHSVEEADRALAAAKAREAELSQATKHQGVQASVIEDQALVASACVLSLEEEH